MKRVSTPDGRSRPVLILGGIAAGSLVLSNGLPPLTPDQFDWIGPAVGLLGLTITAVVTFITQGKVTPLDDPRDNAGRQLIPRYSAAPGKVTYDVIGGEPPADPTTTPGD